MGIEADQVTWSYALHGARRRPVIILAFIITGDLRDSIWCTLQYNVAVASYTFLVMLRMHAYHSMERRATRLQYFMIAQTEQWPAPRVCIFQLGILNDRCFWHWETPAANFWARFSVLIFSLAARVVLATSEDAIFNLQPQVEFNEIYARQYNSIRKKHASAARSAARRSRIWICLISGQRNR